MRIDEDGFLDPQPCTECAKNTTVRDDLTHCQNALAIIQGVPNTAEGAAMARGIAEEALSAINAL